MSAEALPVVELHLGAYLDSVRQRLREWEADRFVERLWAADHRLWVRDPEPELTDRLGWLGLPESMRSAVEGFQRLGREVASAGIDDVILLGMGGSSLAPEVFQRVLGNADGFPPLTVVDTTHPDAVARIAASTDASRSLYVVSSKSGSTIETLSLFRYFWSRVDEVVESPGSRFVAITDPGSSLETLGSERGFRAVVAAPPDVGGRYSALSPFGLVPAALIGVELEGLLALAGSMADECREAGAGANPGVELGAVLGQLALEGRDKLTLLTSERLRSFPDWLEQLIAESTGKDGRGIVPVAGEARGEASSYGEDRVFAVLSLEGDPDDGLSEFLRAAGEAGHPWLRVSLSHPGELGAEMFRWEMATAVASSALGVNPFNQENVQLAKELARSAMAGESAGSGAPVDEIAVDAEGLASTLGSWMDSGGAGDYYGLQAYLAPTRAVAELLSRLQDTLRRRTGRAVTSGFGPRFLHSTGQLHKGGANNGLFLQLVDEPHAALDVPESDYSFGRLIAAQAEGDAAALVQGGRRLLRVHLGRDAVSGLDRLLAATG